MLKLTVSFYRHFVLQNVFKITFLLYLCLRYTSKENSIPYMWAVTVFSTLRFVSSSQANRHFVYGVQLHCVFHAKICVIILNEYIHFSTNFYLPFWWSSISHIPQKKILFLTCRLYFSSTVLSMLSFVSSSQMNKFVIMCFKNFVYLEDFILSAQTLFPPELSADFSFKFERHILIFLSYGTKVTICEGLSQPESQ